MAVLVKMALSAGTETESKISSTATSHPNSNPFTLGVIIAIVIGSSFVVFVLVAFVCVKVSRRRAARRNAAALQGEYVDTDVHGSGNDNGDTSTMGARAPNKLRKRSSSTSRPRETSPIRRISLPILPPIFSRRSSFNFFGGDGSSNDFRGAPQGRRARGHSCRRRNSNWIGEDAIHGPKVKKRRNGGRKSIRESWPLKAITPTLSKLNLPSLPLHHHHEREAENLVIGSQDSIVETIPIRKLPEPLRPVLVIPKKPAPQISSPHPLIYEEIGSSRGVQSSRSPLGGSCGSRRPSATRNRQSSTDSALSQILLSTERRLQEGTITGVARRNRLSGVGSPSPTRRAGRSRENLLGRSDTADDDLPLSQPQLRLGTWTPSPTKTSPPGQPQSGANSGHTRQLSATSFTPEPDSLLGNDAFATPSDLPSSLSSPSRSKSREKDQEKQQQQQQLPSPSSALMDESPSSSISSSLSTVYSEDEHEDNTQVTSLPSPSVSEEMHKITVVPMTRPTSAIDDPFISLPSASPTSNPQGWSPKWGPPSPSQTLTTVKGDRSATPPKPSLIFASPRTANASPLPSGGFHSSSQENGKDGHEFVGREGEEPQSPSIRKVFPPPHELRARSSSPVLGSDEEEDWISILAPSEVPSPLIGSEAKMHRIRPTGPSPIGSLSRRTHGDGVTSSQGGGGRAKRVVSVASSVYSQYVDDPNAASSPDKMPSVGHIGDPQYKYNCPPHVPVAVMIEEVGIETTGNKGNKDNNNSTGRHDEAATSVDSRLLLPTQTKVRLEETRGNAADRYLVTSTIAELRRMNSQVSTCSAASSSVANEGGGGTVSVENPAPLPTLRGGGGGGGDGGIGTRSSKGVNSSRFYLSLGATGGGRARENKKDRNSGGASRPPQNRSSVCQSHGHGNQLCYAMAIWCPGTHSCDSHHDGAGFDSSGDGQLHEEEDEADAADGGDDRTMSLKMPKVDFDRFSGQFVPELSERFLQGFGMASVPETPSKGNAKFAGLGKVGVAAAARRGPVDVSPDRRSVESLGLYDQDGFLIGSPDRAYASRGLRV